MVPTPFPHDVLIDLWPADWLRAIRNEFPAYDDPGWTHYPMEQERGKKAGGEHMWGPATRDWFTMVRHSNSVAMIERITGLTGLVADDLGGGMHCTGEGGRLGMHTDFSIHPNMPHMTRRINLLVFLEDEWQKEWGGVLYLGRNREVEVLPLFNHTAIFETSSKSYHGHPEPIVGAHLRRSLAVYFYAPRRPDDDLLSTTVWLSDTNPNDWTIVR